MTLDRLFHDKGYWQEDAFNRIKSELLSVKGNRFVQYKYTAATHFVCVYGKSQVGKTTLILNMIGLKDEYKRDVAEVLRGGIALGNSSTSTAIIYSPSESDLYGVRSETLEGKILSVVEDCTSDEMRQKLQSIRSDVEKNSFSNNAILHIYIPKNYFSSSEKENKISILDLPGIESRNIHEKAHVESLMNRYIPISSVCIIACTANEIQSLEKFELPNNIDWKNLPHRFYVVITRSYSAGNIKSYFDQRNQRDIGFMDFIKKEYRNALSNILGNNYKTKIFLLEMGDSFVSLCKELKNEKDRSEVIETRNWHLSSLVDSILSSKGSNLQSCIKELRAMVNKIEENKIVQLREIGKKKEVDKKKIVKRIKELKSNKNNNKDKNQENESSIEQLDNLSNTIENELLNAATSFSDNLIEIIKKEIVEKSLFKEKNGVRYFYDKNRVCMKGIQNHLMIYLNKTIGSKVRSLLEDSEFNIDFYPSSIANSIYSQFANMYEKELYPPSSFFKNLFGNSRKVDISSAYSYIQKIKAIIQSEIRSSVIKKCQTKICEKRDHYLVESKECKSKLKKEEKKIESKEEELKRIKDEIDTNNEELLAVENQKRQDEQTLDDYLKYAQEAYLSQRNEIFKSINSKNTSPTDKFLYILLLSLIDKDYKNITNASNE